MAFHNTAREPFFEDLVDHMAAICSTPIACVAIVEPPRQWINGGGAKGHEAAKGEAFDALHMLGPCRAVVNDARDREEMEQAGVAAYIAMPLVINGEEVGALYLVDNQPRTWTDFEISYMERSSRLIGAHIQARNALAERDRRIELERQLAEAGALYQAMLASLHEGLIVQNSDGSFSEANPAVAKIFGLTDDQMSGRDPSSEQRSVVDESGHELSVEAYPSSIALATGEAQLGKILGIERPSGERRWIEVNAVPMAAPEGERPTRVVSTFSDITERLQREQQLADALRKAEHAAESKQQFLANMSHEIRTPLNGVLGMAQVLASTQLDEAQREFVATIIDSGRTLTALLNDVLDLSKIEAGKFEIAPASANLADLLRRQLKLWRPRAEEKGLGLYLALDTDLPELLSFDSVRVQQCVSNLMSNAIKFTSSGEVGVLVAARRAGAGYNVEIRVRDTGIGMDAETLERLFQPFTQADATTQRSYGGTGLGLSIAKRLSELMGGGMKVTSEIGRGSTFILTFRAGAVLRAVPPPEEEHDADEPVSRLRLTNLRVLLVDDHPVNRKIASMFLRPYNVMVTEASNGREALEALNRQPFDLVLLDMHMPVMDGPAAVRAIRSSGAAWSSIPVIALTADAMSGDRERYLALGMNGYLSKPLAEREMLSEIIRVRNAAFVAKAA